MGNRRNELTMVFRTKNGPDSLDCSLFVLENLKELLGVPVLEAKTKVPQKPLDEFILKNDRNDKTWIVKFKTTDVFVEFSVRSSLLMDSLGTICLFVSPRERQSTRLILEMFSCFFLKSCSHKSVLLAFSEDCETAVNITTKLKGDRKVPVLVYPSIKKCTYPYLYLTDNTCVIAGDILDDRDMLNKCTLYLAANFIERLLLGFWRRPWDNKLSFFQPDIETPVFPSENEGDYYLNNVLSFDFLMKNGIKTTLSLLKVFLQKKGLVKSLFWDVFKSIANKEIKTIKVCEKHKSNRANLFLSFRISNGLTAEDFSSTIYTPLKRVFHDQLIEQNDSDTPFKSFVKGNKSTKKSWQTKFKSEVATINATFSLSEIPNTVGVISMKMIPKVPLSTSEGIEFLLPGLLELIPLECVDEIVITDSDTEELLRGKFRNSRYVPLVSYPVIKINSDAYILKTKDVCILIPEILAEKNKLIKSTYYLACTPIERFLRGLWKKPW